MWHCSVHVEGKPHPKADTSKKYMLNLIGSDWYIDWQARLDYSLSCHPVGLRLTTKHGSMYAMSNRSKTWTLSQGLQGGIKIFYLQTKSPPLPKGKVQKLILRPFKSASVASVASTKFRLLRSKGPLLGEFSESSIPVHGSPFTSTDTSSAWHDFTGTKKHTPRIVDDQIVFQKHLQKR